MDGLQKSKKSVRGKARTLVAVVAAMAFLTVPTAAHALPSSEPDYGVEGEPLPAPDPGNVSNPWIVQLENGKICGHSTGTIVAVRLQSGPT